MATNRVGGRGPLDGEDEGDGCDQAEGGLVGHRAGGASAPTLKRVSCTYENTITKSDGRGREPMSRKTVP